MRFFERKGSVRSTLSAIFSSDRVELCISLTNEAGKPRIIFETGKHIDMGPGDKPLLTRLTDALTEAANELITEGLTHIVSRKMAKGHFDSIEIFYGAPWYVSRGRHVLIQRAETTPISEKTLQSLMMENIEGLLPPEMQQGAIILEEHAHGFTVNGYPVENPVGTEGAEIGMRLFISAIDAATKESVEKIFEGSFHTREINHHSVLLPLIQSLRRSNSAGDSCLLVEISGYITEVSKIGRGMVLDTVSFPEGFETIMRTAAAALKRRPEEMPTIAKRPDDFGLTEEFRIAHDEALSGWRRGYAEAWQTLGTEGMAQDVIVITDGPSSEAFKREIALIGGNSVFVPQKDSYLSSYDPSARSNARILSALLVAF